MSQFETCGVCHAAGPCPHSECLPPHDTEPPVVLPPEAHWFKSASFRAAFNAVTPAQATELAVRDTILPAPPEVEATWDEPVNPHAEADADAMRNTFGRSRCSARHREAGGDNAYSCTRGEKHVGIHVSATYGKIDFRWEDLAEAVAARNRLRSERDDARAMLAECQAEICRLRAGGPLDPNRRIGLTPAGVAAADQAAGADAHCLGCAECEGVPRATRSIEDRLRALGGDELAVVEAIVARLEIGRRQYGALDVHDGRNWTSEASAELLDGTVYLAAQLVRLRRPK